MTASRAKVAFCMHYKWDHIKRTEESVHELISSMSENKALACGHFEHYIVRFFRAVFALA